MKLKIKKIYIVYLLLFIVNFIMLITGGVDINIFVGTYEELWGSGNLNYVYLLIVNLITIIIINIINIILLINKNNKNKFKWLIFLFITILTLFIPIAQDKKINKITENEDNKYINFFEIIKKPFK